jgi:hypothetical protein
MPAGGRAIHAAAIGRVISDLMVVSVRVFLLCFLLNRCGPWTKSRSSEESERPRVAVFEALDRPDIRQAVHTASCTYGKLKTYGKLHGCKAWLNAPRQQVYGLMIGKV